MFNQIKADYYRQRHTWGVYVVLVLTLVFSSLITANESTGGIMINTDSMSNFGTAQWSILTGLKSATLSTTVLLYIDIAIFVMVIGQEFSKKVYKNTLISGTSRLSFIVGKFATMLIDILGLTFSYYGMVMLVSHLAGRTAGASTLTLIRTWGLMTLTVAFFISVIFSIGVIILVTLSSVVVAVVFVILWPFLIAILANFSHWQWLKYIDFTDVAQAIALGTLKVESLWPYIGTSIGVLIVAIVGSAIIMQRKEL